MYRSIARLSAQEAAAIRSRKVDVVTVKSGDTIANLSSRMAYANYQQDRFLVLNRLRATDGLQVGQKVKIITY
jgi:predicted Zn-dependent protease